MSDQPTTPPPGSAPMPGTAPWRDGDGVWRELRQSERTGFIGTYGYGADDHGHAEWTPEHGDGPLGSATAADLRAAVAGELVAGDATGGKWAEDRGVIDAASCAPWRVDPDDPRYVIDSRSNFLLEAMADRDPVTDLANVAFAARARTRWPAALDEVDRLRAQVAALAAERDRLAADRDLVSCDCDYLREQIARMNAGRDDPADADGYWAMTLAPPVGVAVELRLAGGGTVVGRRTVGGWYSAGKHDNVTCFSGWRLAVPAVGQDG